MKLRDILNAKGRDVHTISCQATLGDVVDRLVEFNCGSLVVFDGESMVGIITERDILRSCASNGHALQTKLVKDHMTPEPITSEPEAELGYVMGLLTEKRIRHLPVVQTGRLVGIISIGDVVKAQHDALSQENHFLKSYIHG